MHDNAILRIVKIMQPTLNDSYVINRHKYLLYNKYFATIMYSMRYTIKDFRRDFPNDDVCLDTVFKERYGDIDTCPSCGVIGTHFYRVKGRKCYACEWCGYQLHPLAETIFHKSSTPLTSWFYAIYLFSVSKNGVAAKELERHLGVTYKTAHLMARQIRSLMAQADGGLSGTVEADETYIGGHRRSTARWENKSPVLGVVERGGEVRAKVTIGANASTALPFLRNNVEKDGFIMTDDSKVYHRLKREYGHDVINHSEKKYGRGIVYTNTIEGFWSQMKRSIDGTYHAVSPKYLQLYVNEFVFRYNLRGVVVYPALLERASKPVESIL
ncbi:MAG: IS1595 family transposase [Candidatus Microsaccharimonas sossegonensis]|uniref:IS1595 family transposase n=1 Tax=Candidatus Microsaccharimonas sossegonensis TaxID=2506948 RepID=A0A4Q0AHL6_9BACT|nr:MAG: IS1595 family transposase [Candidatus Microsaccharimonas sossegonensis]